MAPASAIAPGSWAVKCIGAAMPRCRANIYSAIGRQETGVPYTRSRSPASFQAGQPLSPISSSIEAQIFSRLLKPRHPRFFRLRQAKCTSHCSARTVGRADKKGVLGSYGRTASVRRSEEHRVARIRVAVDRRGCGLVRLPPASAVLGPRNTGHMGAPDGDRRLCSA